MIRLHFKYKMIDLLFDFAENLKLDGEVREQFAVEFFRFTMANGMLDMTVLICEHYRV